MLFSIGLTFMAVATVDYLVGSQQQNVQLPDFFRQRFEFGAGFWMLGMGAYRLFIVIVCVLLAVVLQQLLARTRFGSRLRAAVDDPRGGGPASRWIRSSLSPSRWARASRALAGAGADIPGLDPSFPPRVHGLFPDRLRGGRHQLHHRPLVAALLLGIADVMGKNYVPKLGSFIVSPADDWPAAVAPQGLFSRGAGDERRAAGAARAGALARVGDRGLVLLWAAPFVFPSRMRPLINEIAILALFAPSLDLILGYAGIISLGHAAFFGVGAYGAALCWHVMPDPLVGPRWARRWSAAGPHHQPHDCPGHRPTRLMVTMGVALVLLRAGQQVRRHHRRRRWATRRGDGGRCSVASSSTSRPGLPASYLLSVLFIAFVLLRRMVHSPLGVRCRPCATTGCVCGTGIPVQGG